MNAFAFIRLFESCVWDGDRDKVMDACRIPSKGWVAPDGTIVAVSRHSSWRYKGVDYRYGQTPIPGWARLIREGNRVFVHCQSDSQRRTLKDLCLEHGLEFVDESQARNQTQRSL